MVPVICLNGFATNSINAKKNNSTASPIEAANAKATKEISDADPRCAATQAVDKPPPHAPTEPPAAITPNSLFACRGKLVVDDLAALLQRIRASLELVEQAIVVEASAGKEDIGADVVVLDDVTPGYVQAGVALQACGANLGLALHLLQEPINAGMTVTGGPAGAREPHAAARA